MNVTPCSGDGRITKVVLSRLTERERVAIWDGILGASKFCAPILDEASETLHTA